MIVYLDSPLTCRGKSANLCEQLADEIASFTLENYEPITGIDRLALIITEIDAEGTPSTSSKLEKQMSLPDWRRELNTALK